MGVGIQVSRRETATLATVYDDRMARVEAGLGGGDLSCAGFVANGRKWRTDKPRERRKLLKAKGLAIILGLEKVDLGMPIAFRRAREFSSRFTDADGGRLDKARTVPSASLRNLNAPFTISINFCKQTATKATAWHAVPRRRRQTNMCCGHKLSPLRVLALAMTTAAFGYLAARAEAQFFRQNAVGGVKIDADGVVSNPEVGELRELQSAWQQGLADVPADLEPLVDRRYVSLKKLEAQIADARAKGIETPEAVKYLGGLQRVEFVLVYPEQNDIVIAGPAEGWRVDARGNVVGATTGRPVLLLDDLMVALRVAESANASGISCSIDPTPEGLARMQQLRLSSRDGVQVAARQMEEAVGPQSITVTGVPATSHFARAIVAADFRMKRLAMNFEPAPVDGLPSFLEMLSGRRSGMHNSMPRWWLAPNYEPLRRDEQGLAWELRGQGVKCMTEQDFINEAGERAHSGKADATAQKWADLFTEKFDELAREDSSFGALRNVMDLAVVGALLAKEGLLEHSGLSMPNIMGDEPIAEFPAPRSVASQSSFVKAGREWVISVSGGVQIYPWQVADRTEVSANLAQARETKPQDEAAWFWQQ